MVLNGDGVSNRIPLWTGYGLATAEILYRMPDHPKILQSYVWQDYDMTPNFPALNRFLTFWRATLEGAIHSVRVGHAALVKPSELKVVGTEFRLQ